MDCVLKINSGAGGIESQDWASMLMRMYMRWAESNGYKLSVANLQEGDEAGIKTVTMNICLLYTSPSPRDRTRSRMPSSACKKKYKK